MRQTSSSLFRSMRLAALAAAAGATVAVAAEDRIPVVYVIPMTGQMGTDIHPDIYEEIIEDANEVKPDIVVFRLHSAEVDNNFHIENDDRRESGEWRMMEDYRDLMFEMKKDIGVDEKNQYMWVEDAVGPSALIAMTCPQEQLFMSADARLWGFEQIRALAGDWADEDIFAKMYAARVGIATAFAQMGNWPMELSKAMIEPQHKLGVRFNGRTPEFTNDLSGVFWTIDSSEERVARFDGDSAEQVMLSKGTVSDLDDLLFLIGCREYEIADSGEKIHEQYVEDWRRVYEACGGYLKDIRDRGGNTIQDLGAQRGLWQKIMAGMKRYPAVELRMRREYGLTVAGAETEIERIKEAIRRDRQNNRGNNRGGRGGGGGGGGLGG